MRSPTLTTAAFAAILAYITTLSSGSVGVLATRHADPLYAGAGGRHHGYRPDLAAAVIAHNNRMRAAAAARVAAAAGDSGPEGEDDSPPNGNSSNSAGGPPGTGSGSGPSGSGSGSSGSGSSNGGPHPSSGASLPPECVPISSTHSCAPWTTGYYINKTELALVYGLAAGTTPDPAYWDKLVEAMTGGGDLQAAIWAEWAQCNGYRGAPIQYYRSYVCLTDIFFYSAGCNPGTKISPPLHPDVCDVYKEAVAGLVQDPNACPSLESLSSTLQGPALQDVFDRRTFLLSADQSCRSVLNNYAKSSDATVWGVTADQVSCGFGGNVTVASKYCDDVFEQFHQKPKCCESLSGGSPSASSQSSGFAPPSANLRTDSLNVAAAAAAADGTAAGQDAGSGAPVGAIVGGVAGGAVVIGGALAAFAVVTKRNQNRKQTGKQPATKVAPLSSISTSGGPSMQQVPDAAAMGADYVTLPPGTRFVGILEFQPTNPDEMEVNEGDIIEGKIQFSDGWMKGYNHESQETGLFPSAVVKPLNS